MYPQQYETIAKLIRLKIIHFATLNQLPYNLVLFCLSINVDLVPSPLREKIANLKQFFVLEKQDANSFPLNLKEFTKHSIDIHVLKEGIQKFTQEEISRYGRLKLGELCLILAFQKKAADGKPYSNNYTEFKLLKEANYIELENGSIKIEWNKEPGSCYEKHYSLSQEKHYPLDKELQVLGNCCEIEFIPINANYHEGCILLPSSADRLKKYGFLHGSEESDSFYREGEKLYKLLEDKSEESLNESVHQAINLIVSNLLNTTCKQRSNALWIRLANIRLSHFQNFLQIDFPIALINGLVSYEYYLQDLILEFENKDIKEQYLPLIASLLDIPVEKLGQNDVDLKMNCLCLPQSMMKKLFGISFQETLDLPQLELVTQRHCVWGEDATDLDDQLIKMSDKLNPRANAYSTRS